MTDWRKTWLNAAILLLSGAMLLSGCAGGGTTMAETGGQTLSQQVTTEYLLTTAGFKKLRVNESETPKWQALLNNLPPGKISTYIRNGEVYYVYPDEGSNTLYLGNEAAYQKYASLAQGRKLCQQVTGPDQEKFWICMDEYQQAEKLQPRK